MKAMDVYYKMPAVLRNSAISVYGAWQAYQRFSGRFRWWYESLLESQYLTQDELECVQLERLRSVLNHAYSTVPYYRQAFDRHGIRPEDVLEVDDLAGLPMLTRDDVRENLQSLRSSSISAYSPITCMSSGSTGQKLQYVLPRDIKRAFNVAMQWRYYSWAGVHRGDRRATLGARIFATRPPYFAWNPWENQLLLSSHHMTRENMRLYAELMKRYHVDFIQGHASAIAVLAEYMLNEDERIPLRGVFTTGETVYPNDRDRIESAFQCRLLDSYGMGESAAAAQQCDRADGYHEISEGCIIELEPLGDGTYEVIGTSLLNYAMPFIRYRTGDIAEPADVAQCQCGRGLPLRISKVLGRIDDKLVFADRTVLPVTVRMHMKPLLEAGENYQVRQEEPGWVRVILTGSVDVARVQQVRSELLSLLPRGTQVSVEHAETITGKNNKIRNVVSLVAAEEARFRNQAGR